MKTETQQFIEDAIKGDYSGTPLVKKGSWFGILTWSHDLATNDDQAHFMAMLVDPLAWKAVGKTRGWNKYVPTPGEPSVLWKDTWHRFIDALIDGKTIEEALAFTTS